MFSDTKIDQFLCLHVNLIHVRKPFLSASIEKYFFCTFFRAFPYFCMEANGDIVQNLQY